eukprot:SAG22_NODE_1835_length_3468_cov_3.304541_4_plen_388_part_00
MAADDDEDGEEVMKIEHQAAAFVLGRGGSTKRKIERVSECRLDLDEKDGTIRMRGTKAHRDKAREYVDIVNQQRESSNNGPPVRVEIEGRNDLTVVSVPGDCCGFVMGKGGATLRSMEEEWNTLMCFAKVEDKEKLCIFGNFRARHGCELKIMSAIEHKRKGHCVDGDELLFDKRIPSDQNEEGWDVETRLLLDDDYAYALGARGSTRRKLAKASGCILEYVGHLACMAGYQKERQRAQEYLRWLLEQRTSSMGPIDTEDRDDLTTMTVPTKSVGFVTGHKGEGLRFVEQRTGTFMFTNPASKEDEGSEQLLIFGCVEADRRKAKEIIEDRIQDHERGVRTVLNLVVPGASLPVVPVAAARSYAVADADAAAAVPLRIPSGFSTGCG